MVVDANARRRSQPLPSTAARSFAPLAPLALARAAAVALVSFFLGRAFERHSLKSRSPNAKTNRRSERLTRSGVGTTDENWDDSYASEFGADDDSRSVYIASRMRAYDEQLAREIEDIERTSDSALRNVSIRVDDGNQSRASSELGSRVRDGTRDDVFVSSDRFERSSYDDVPSPISSYRLVNPTP